MLKIGAEQFARTLAAIATFLSGGRMLSELNSPLSIEWRQATINPEDAEMAGLAFNKFLEEVETLGAATTKIALNRALRSIAEGKCSNEDLHRYYEDVQSRLLDELSSKLVFVLGPKHAEWFASDFGPEVAQKFPSVAYDFDEAMKCLALNRSTATAFHALRCLEVGITALSRSLGIPDPTKGSERSWAQALDKLKNAMQTKWPGSVINADRQIFESAYAALAAMQNPWRNATMHLDQKYTADEAEHIVGAVKGFMRRVGPEHPTHADDSAVAEELAHVQGLCLRRYGEGVGRAVEGDADSTATPLGGIQPSPGANCPAPQIGVPTPAPTLPRPGCTAARWRSS